MLFQLFQKRSVFYLYRLVKPNLSQFKSIQQLQYDQKQREINLIQQINQSTLAQNKSYTKEKLISQILNVSQQISSTVAKRHLNFSAIAPNTLKHYTLEQNYLDGKIDYPFLLEQVEANLPNFDSIPKHFSLNRGVAVIPQYELDKKTAYVFNLPEDLNVRELSEKLGADTVKQIKVQYCRLGLPAYAKVYFHTDEAVTNIVLNSKTYTQLGNRICFIKTHFDKEKLQLKNRRLVIQNIDQDQSDLILQLSEYGRITHFDYPTFITRNVSLEQVRAHYTDSDTLIKINHHRKDGSIDAQYYPSLQQSFKMNTSASSQDFDANIIQKKQRQRAMYLNRMRYAQQVNVFQGKQNQISITNMGYFVVTYSCTEQAQNCYFNMRLSHKTRLYDAKNMEEFQFDQEYRKRILRFVDGEYRRTKDHIQASKTLHEKDLDEYFDQLSLFDKLIDIQTHKKAIKQRIDDQYEEEPQVLISYFVTRVNQVKRYLGSKMGTQSFDQLAQKELFGRVLPKHDAKKPKMTIDILPEIRPEVKQVIDGEKLRYISSTGVKRRETFYKRLKHRETKRKGMDDQVPEGQEEFAQGQGQLGAQVQQEADEDYTGQRGFSTAKKRIVTFRQRKALQHANYILRYCQYIRDIINQYQGIFKQSRLKPSNVLASPTFFNPDMLAFSDGSPFVVEEDLPKFLECMRDIGVSQEIYTDFAKDNQLFKSKSLDINEYRENIKNKKYEAIEQYVDSGVVKEVYQVENGEDVQAKVQYLNATVAAFGQQFRVHEDSNGKVIVKIAKVQNIFPLDRMTIISNQKAKFDKQFTPTQSQQRVFNKYKHHIIQTGQIPEQVRSQFNISSETTLDELFAQLASEAGIYKKDIETVLNLDNFTPQQIGEDVGLQVQLQKSRMAHRESRASDYAKDPNNIEVRDKEGYFKVSKFRQI